MRDPSIKGCLVVMFTLASVSLSIVPLSSSLLRSPRNLILYLHHRPREASEVSVDGEVKVRGDDLRKDGSRCRECRCGKD